MENSMGRKGRPKNGSLLPQELSTATLSPSAPSSSKLFLGFLLPFQGACYP